MHVLYYIVGKTNNATPATFSLWPMAAAVRRTKREKGSEAPLGKLSEEFP